MTMTLMSTYKNARAQSPGPSDALALSISLGVLSNGLKVNYRLYLDTIFTWTRVIQTSTACAPRFVVQRFTNALDTCVTFAVLEILRDALS